MKDAAWKASVGGRIILKWILNKWGGYRWRRMETSFGL
jgi:hypothetical protein